MSEKELKTRSDLHFVVGTGNLPAFLAGTPETMTYDLDGNLASDGRWNYYYDAENRLYWMQTTQSAVNAEAENGVRLCTFAVAKELKTGSSRQLPKHEE